jgi:hypothetical protein
VEYYNFTPKRLVIFSKRAKKFQKEPKFSKGAKNFQKEPKILFMLNCVVPFCVEITTTTKKKDA